MSLSVLWVASFLLAIVSCWVESFWMLGIGIAGLVVDAVLEIHQRRGGVA